jgi:pantothenate synthetase
MEIIFGNDDKVLIVKRIDFDKVSTLGDVCPNFDVLNVPELAPEVIRGWNLLAISSRNIYKSPDQEAKAFACTIRNDLRFDNTVACRGARPYSAENFRHDNHDDGTFAVIEQLGTKTDDSPSLMLAISH